jgi:2-polyprenyl-6-methoxyphenol hydroxylase-like FAD-dependent oxidoreductase
MLRGDVEQAFAALPADVEIRYSTVPTRIEQDADGVDVTLTNTADGTTVTERFDLVVGADGLRSTVRSLVFGPHEQYLHRLNYMIAAFALPGSLSDLAHEDGATLLEPGRSMWIFPFADHAPTVLLSYRTDDVDAEPPPRADPRRVRPPADRPCARRGPPGTGVGRRTAVRLGRAGTHRPLAPRPGCARGRLGVVRDPVRRDGRLGRSGRGGSARHHARTPPRNVELALTEWERRLRPYIEYYQHNGISQRAFFTQTSRVQIALRKLLMRGQKLPLAGRLLQHMRESGKASRMKEMDIARA